LVEGPTDNPGKGDANVTDSVAVKKDSTNANSCTECHGPLMEKKLKHPTKNANACMDCHMPGTKDHPKTAIG